MKYLIFLIIIISTLLIPDIFANTNILPESANIVKDVSISISGHSATIIDVTHTIGWKILKVLKILITGLALVYIVMIGVWMIIESDNEDKIKAQRRQILYVLIGFLFLNIPGTLYQIFFMNDNSTKTLDTPSTGDGSIVDIIFINSTNFGGIFGGLITFFEVFIFGVAILTFTYGLFRLIFSGGNDERQKAAKGKLIYGTLGLIFLGFVKIWGVMIVRGNFSDEGEIVTIGKKIVGLALYFSGPVAIFFILLAAFYLLTSAGDEERVKKGKAILINTLIAALILVASYSLLSDITGFINSF